MILEGCHVVSGPDMLFMLNEFKKYVCLFFANFTFDTDRLELFKILLLFLRYDMDKLGRQQDRCPLSLDAKLALEVAHHVAEVDVKKFPTFLSKYFLKFAFSSYL